MNYQHLSLCPQHTEAQLRYFWYTLWAQGCLSSHWMVFRLYSTQIPILTSFLKNVGVQSRFEETSVQCNCIAMVVVLIYQCFLCTLMNVAQIQTHQEKNKDTHKLHKLHLMRYTYCMSTSVDFYIEDYITWCTYWMISRSKHYGHPSEGLYITLTCNDSRHV